MNAPYRLITIVSVFVFFLHATQAFAEKPAQPDPYLDFAHHLFKENDYDRAITEAKRFLFLHPDSKRKNEAQLLIARAYYESNKFEDAKLAFIPLVAQRDDEELMAKATVQLGRCLEKLDPTGDAVAYYKGLINEPSLPARYAGDLRNIARYRLGWSLLEAGKWEEASSLFHSLDNGHPLKGSARDLSDKMLQANDLDYKSPKLAGVMSGVLPGAGQLYVGRPTDAALAFSLNAAFIWGGVEAFNNENWVVFGLLGIMEIGWYGGNIYNAVNGAHIHNREERAGFINRLKRDHGWRLGYEPSRDGYSISWTSEY